MDVLLKRRCIWAN